MTVSTIKLSSKGLTLPAEGTATVVITEVSSGSLVATATTLTIILSTFTGSDSLVVESPLVPKF